MKNNIHSRSLPSPENSELKTYFADQTLPEFLGEGSQLIFGYQPIVDC